MPTSLFAAVSISRFYGIQRVNELTRCLLVSSADDICKQFGPRPDPNFNCFPVRIF